MKSKPFVDRFLARIDKTPGYGPKGECWKWLGPHTAGRAIIGVGPRGAGYVYVARPDGLEPDHLCRFPACINPAHLEPVTHQENIRRACGKTVCHRGHPRTPENLTQHRTCRTCANNRRRQQRQQEQSNAR